jgi:hypothetical protein
MEVGEWSASHPSFFSPGKTAAITHWREGWVNPRPGLDVMEKRKIS